jgi:hypothetical protein
MKRLIGNVLATLAAAAVGALTLWASVRYLKEPDGTADWIVLLLSGATTGTLTFFLVWGHFQDEPVVEPVKGVSGRGDDGSSQSGAPGEGPPPATNP